MAVPSDEARGDLAVALEYLVALEANDPNRVLVLVAESFRNEHHAALGSGSIGRDDYAQRLPGFFSTFTKRSYEVLDTSVGKLTTDDSNDGTEVIVNYRFRARVDGKRINIPGIMWISVRDGEITRRLDSWDSLVFHRQTGTNPSIGGS